MTREEAEKVLDRICEKIVSEFKLVSVRAMATLEDLASERDVETRPSLRLVSIRDASSSNQ